MNKWISIFAVAHETPVSDVEPMRHGEWVTPDGCVSPFCSACGAPAIKTWNGGYAVPKYCPNCGAKIVIKP